MVKVVIEIKDNKIIGVFGSEPLEVSVYRDIDIMNMTDEEIDRLDEINASVPYDYEPDETTI